MEYIILLYYHYTLVVQPTAFCEAHYRYCVENNLLGRIIIASEGINGTLSGLKADVEQYMQYLRNQPGFDKIEFKIEPHHQHVFQKINVRVKSEIVHSGLHDINPRERTGTHVSPQAFQEMLEDPEVVVLDVRSNYEHTIGKFKNSVTLDLENFRDFPATVPTLEPYKDKKVITVCTGGIKCEKASAFLLEKGFKNVYQLHGGIINYGQQTEGAAFAGKCYVFDNRLVTDINKTSHTVVSQCFSCQVPCDRIINCANPWCNNHIPLCHACGEKLEGGCSEPCKQHPDKRAYNGTGYYVRKTVGYNPSKTLQKKKVKKAD